MALVRTLDTLAVHRPVVAVHRLALAEMPQLVEPVQVVRQVRLLAPQQVLLVPLPVP